MAAYYEENGYVVVEGFLPVSLIDGIVARYSQDILPSTGKFYRQNTKANGMRS